MSTMAWRAVEREGRIYRHLWRGNFFSSFVSPLLYLGAMGIGLGGLVDARSQGIGDLPYLQFVAPGLLAATALQLTAGDSLWPVMGGMKWTRHFHAMVASPMRPADVYLGGLLWLAARLVVSSSAFLVVAAMLGGVRSPGAVLAVPAAVLAGVSLGAPLMAFAATQDQDGNFGLVMRLLVLPLFLFSGTFFPVDLLPDGVRPLLWLSPLWHGVELCRAATTGRWSALGPVATLAHVAVLGALTAAGAAVGIRTFTRRLTA
jgi:lipooligosaccharide transport system permease protein